jgi:hypothetical protein
MKLLAVTAASAALLAPAGALARRPISARRQRRPRPRPSPRRPATASIGAPPAWGAGAAGGFLLIAAGGFVAAYRVRLEH